MGEKSDLQKVIRREYPAGHNRPVHEVLSGNRLNIEPAFVNEFAGMADGTVALPELLEVREKLFTEIPNRLSREQHQFLLGLAHAEPDWSLMKQPHLPSMPAIAWKLANLRIQPEEVPGTGRGAGACFGGVTE